MEFCWMSFSLAIALWKIGPGISLGIGRLRAGFACISFSLVGIHLDGHGGGLLEYGIEAGVGGSDQLSRLLGKKSWGFHLAAVW